MEMKQVAEISDFSEEVAHTRRNANAPANRVAMRSFVRLRGSTDLEQYQPQCLFIAGNVVSTEGPINERAHRQLACDTAMDSSDPSQPAYVSQERCYRSTTQPMVSHFLDGFNTCVICHGQTGSGKTTTLMGDLEVPESWGLLPRFLRDVFEEIARLRELGETLTVQVVMLELYGKGNKYEEIRDLLGRHGNRAPDQSGRVRMSIASGLRGALEKSIDSFSDCLDVLQRAAKMRTTQATAMNRQSSRGHTVLKFILHRNTRSSQSSSEAVFVDLAGRENQKTTQNTGIRLEELGYINTTSMLLSEFLQHLSQRSEQGKKPMSDIKELGRFRNTLTQILFKALTGNSNTAVIGCLSPAMCNLNESLTTLTLAAACSKIKLQPRSSLRASVMHAQQNPINEIKRLQSELAATQFRNEELQARLVVAEARLAENVACDAKLELVNGENCDSQTGGNDSPRSVSTCIDDDSVSSGFSVSSGVFTFSSVWV